MTLYDVLLFLHISAAIIWVGSGFLLHVLAFRAERANDPAALLPVLRDMGTLGNTLFVPASLAAFLFGLGMVLEGPWSFSDLWISLGLAGFLATFAIGLFILKPRGEEIGAIITRDGGITSDVMVKARQLAIIGRIDAVVLFLVVAVMALKPTIYDVAELGAMAAILVVGTVLALAAARSVAAKAAANPAG
jgi:Predicted integral membrane protein (DUF2269)